MNSGLLLGQFVEENYFPANGANAGGHGDAVKNGVHNTTFEVDGSA